VQCLVYAAFAAPLGMYGAAWPDARHLFAQSAGALGALGVAYGIGRTATSASGLAVVARAGMRRALVVLCVALAAADLVIALTRSFPVLIAGLAAVGLVSGALDSLGGRFQTLLRDVGRAGLMFGAYGLGATLGPALVAVTSWTVGYLAAAAVALLAAAMAARRSVAWPEGLAEGSRLQPAPDGRRMDPAAVLVSLALAGTCVGLEALTGNWAATYLEDHRGASTRLAGLAVSAFWAGSTLGRLLLRQIPLPPRRILEVGSVVVLLAYAAVPVAPVGGAVVVFAAIGVLLAPLFPTVVATTADRVGRAGAGRVSGWQLVAANLSALVLVGGTGAAVSGEGGGGVIIGVLVVLAAVAVPLSWWASRLTAGEAEVPAERRTAERASGATDG
jgi:fucose permease